MSCCSLRGSCSLILHTLLQVHFIVSIEAICVHLFPKKTAKQVVLNVFKYLDFKRFQSSGELRPSLHLLLPLGQNTAPCPGAAVGPSCCLPQGCRGVHGLGCSQHQCPGLSQLRTGAPTQARFARAKSHLDFMLLQLGDQDRCKVTSKENIRYRGRWRDFWWVPHSLFIPRATTSSQMETPDEIFSSSGLWCSSS